MTLQETPAVFVGAVRHPNCIIVSTAICYMMAMDRGGVHIEI